MEDKEKFTTLFFPDELNEETTQTFMKELSTALNEFDKVYIYFTCRGGSGSDANIIVNMINRHKDKIHLILSWQLASAAVDIIFNAECKISIMEDAFVMIHIGTRDIDYRDQLKKDSMEIFIVNDFKKSNDKLVQRWKSFFNLSDKEVEFIATGNDLYLDNDRLVDAMSKKGNVELTYKQQ